jgi:phospholipase/carboxylesterase
MREEFTDSIRILEDFLTYLERTHRLARDRLILLGFSQGAAMAFAATMAPTGGLSTRPAALVVGSGHLPQGDLSGLAGLPVFWGHGRRDELIPVSVARRDIDRLRSARADVQYCEADVGHKLAIACLRELKEWIAVRFALPSRDRVR